MNAIKVPEVKVTYTQNDFDVLGFHDCRICGIEWDEDRFALALSIEYIVQWVEPTRNKDTYSFWISPAQLTFSNVDDAEIMLRWQRASLECTIDDVVRGNTRPTPNGIDQRQWTLRLSEPSGSISLWATAFELKLLKPPVLCDVPRLPVGFE